MKCHELVFCQSKQLVISLVLITKESSYMNKFNWNESHKNSSRDLIKFCKENGSHYLVFVYNCGSAASKLWKIVILGSHLPWVWLPVV